MTRLTDLIIAAYGWLKYKLQRTKPEAALLPDAETLYAVTVPKSAESLARQYDFDYAKTRRLRSIKPQICMSVSLSNLEGVPKFK